MRRVVALALIGGVLFGLLALARRRAGAGMMGMCERMMAEMPESAPPKRFMAALEGLQDRTERILRLLEERVPPVPGEPAAVGEEVGAA